MTSSGMRRGTVIGGPAGGNTAEGVRGQGPGLGARRSGDVQPLMRIPQRVSQQAQATQCAHGDGGGESLSF